MIRSFEPADSGNNRWNTILRWSTLCAISLSCILILAYRLDAAPDIFMDEIIYYRAAFNLATHGNLTWDRSPIFVHPPIHFLTQALFLDLVGLNHGFQPFTGTYVVRLVNVLAAAVSAGLLFLLVERLSNLRTATVVSLFLLLDPFVVRINRRNMLETMAEMWVLAAIFAYWHYRDRLNLRNVLTIGLLFGFALLTKELVFFQFITLPIFMLLSGRWQHLKKLLLIGGIAFCIWLLFPFWAWSLGQWSEFLANKAYNFDRLRGTVQITGWNREGVSFVNALNVNLFQYGTSYLMIVLGASTTTLLFFVGRNERARFIVAWNLTAFAFFAYTIAFGTINDQFFYFLMVPVIVMNFYILMAWVDRLAGYPRPAEPVASGIIALTYPDGTFVHSRFVKWLKWLDGYLAIFNGWLMEIGRVVLRNSMLSKALLALILTAGLTLQSYNAYRWVTLYVIESDNSLFQLSSYIKENIALGTKINSMFDTGEPTLDLMLPGYKIVSLRRQSEIEDQQVEYAILSSKNLWGRYGKITPDYYDWVTKNGKLLFSTYGNSFWQVSLYKLQLGNQKNSDYVAHVLQPSNP